MKCLITENSYEMDDILKSGFWAMMFVGCLVIASGLLGKEEPKTISQNDVNHEINKEVD